MSISDSLASLLSSCEENGLANRYLIDPSTYREAASGFFSPSFPVITVPVDYHAGTDEIIVVSDLHLAAGKNQLGVYTGSENFFADDAFERFLSYTTNQLGDRQAVLVLNGDTFDFLRVTEFPGKVPVVSMATKVKQFLYSEVRKPIVPAQCNAPDSSLAVWQQELSKVGIDKTLQELENSLSDREKKYGLETDDYKTIYKLLRIRIGHPAFFTALSRWLSCGHRLVITKGNHDLELVWPAVRHYIRLLLASPPGGGEIAPFLRQVVLPHVFFADDAVLIDQSVYIEHGHRYDKFAMVLDSPWFSKNPRQISIPFGSFFNRYLINRVELFYPYLDKVRPTGNVVPILVRENFPLAIKIFGSQLPFMIRILFTNGRYIWFMLKRVVPLLLAILPVAIYIYVLFFSGHSNGAAVIPKTGIPGVAWKLIGTTGSLILSYFIARIVAWLQLVEPSSLDGYADRLYRETGSRFPVICMGHTHNPGAYPNETTGLFYNTGTWIPVIETSTADVRADRTFTFLQLVREAGGGYLPAAGNLQRWNDDAGRPEPQLLIKRKS
jgi:UDP-2,3-diacylglucosamine pyrophosphatase LpxH